MSQPVSPMTPEGPRWTPWLRWGVVLLFIAAGLELSYLLLGLVFGGARVGNFDRVLAFSIQVPLFASQGFSGAGLLLTFLALDRRWPSEEHYFAAAAFTAVIGGVGAALLQGYLYYSLIFQESSFDFVRSFQSLSFVSGTFASLLPISLAIGSLGFLRMRPFSRAA